MIMSWNVQNFFDDVDDGSEYWDFDPGNGEWNTDLFNQKAAALAEVITAAAPGGPDIVLLQEIENENALSLLNDGYLKALSYNWAIFMPTEDSAIGCGLLSRQPVIEVKSHAVNSGGSCAGRNISEIDFRISGSGAALKVFVNHWKSKLGGAAETEDRRMASAGLLRSLVFEALAAESSLSVIAAGDFNESYDEWDRVDGEYPTAIQPYPESGSAAGGLLYYTASSEDMSGGGTECLYNPWIDSDCRGSYCYDGVWETIDQFFLSEAAFDGEGLEYSDFRTVELDFNTADDGTPLRWITSSASGCSDHFPVLIEFTELP